MGDQFSAAGYGVTSVGWGERPAIVAVDFQLAFCDPAFATGRSDHIASAVANAEGVLIAGRAAGIPIVHTAVAWSHDDEFTNWKVPSLRDITPDSPAASTLPQLWGDSDIYLLKQYPSAFFGTPLSTILRHRGVDTVLIMGVTTSGCVRASIIDSFSYGFKTIVVEDSCGDQEAGPHEDNMRDVSRRYADLISSADAVSRLESLSP
ncbi:N-carbamoylsarcosine amidase [Actinomycetes bacterium]|nr:N-carbamoylsarcosine amidase [Actinomycetes bacterium]